MLVVGDLIVSRFVEVSARKLAREAPVPAGDYVGETLLPGGAANLARELASLGANVEVVGVVGDDVLVLIRLAEDSARAANSLANFLNGFVQAMPTTPRGVAKADAIAL